MPLALMYWDTSAVISVLLQDIHTADARNWLTKNPVEHLTSGLTSAEFHACIARLEREGHLTAPLADATILAFEQGPWRRLDAVPDPTILWPLARRSQLRGADLWHLALAVTLKRDLPEITLLTYDSALGIAALAEGLVP